jgi:hypothetical protein
MELPVNLSFGLQVIPKNVAEAVSLYEQETNSGRRRQYR